MNAQQQLKLRYSFVNHNMTPDEQEVFGWLIKKSTIYPPDQLPMDRSMHRGHKRFRTWDPKEFKDG